MKTSHFNQLFVYGYFDEETRTVIYQTSYNDAPGDFSRALERCRRIKKSRAGLFFKFEIISIVTTTIQVE